MLMPVKSDLERKLANLRPAEVKPPQPGALSRARMSALQRVSYVGPKPRSPAWLDIKQVGVAALPSTPTVREAGDLEQDYNALKTYLMLHFRERMDAPLLANQLPRHWQKWLESNRNGAPQDEVSHIAGRIVAFYLAQISEPDLPLIENSAELVGDARTVLRSEMRRIPAKERLYNELKARANARYAPLTVGRILNNSDADLIAGSDAVPGAFTREAWDNYLHNAIIEASNGELKGDDWVLAVSMTDLAGVFR